jgi:hypothetical protein
MRRVGWLLGRAAANVVNFFGYDSRLSPEEREAVVGMFREELSVLPTAPEPDVCCNDGDCGGIDTDTLGEAREWWNGK